MKGHTSCPGAFGVAGFHLTNQGPGIFGQGNPAGLFEGDVNVTGALSVQGSNVLQRIGALEQQPGGAALEQKIAALQAQLSSLQNQVNTAVSNLTGRVSLAEVAISSLEARVGALGG